MGWPNIFHICNLLFSSPICERRLLHVLGKWGRDIVTSCNRVRWGSGLLVSRQKIEWNQYLIYFIIWYNGKSTTNICGRYLATPYGRVLHYLWWKLINIIANSQQYILFKLVKLQSTLCEISIWFTLSYDTMGRAQLIFIVVW
jgi:hypothetical protein